MYCLQERSLSQFNHVCDVSSFLVGSRKNVVASQKVNE